MRRPVTTTVDPRAVAAIKSAVRLQELAAELLPLRRVGPDMVGLCPFHSEDTPSFKVHVDYYHCFGCGAAGDAIALVQGTYKLSFMEALRHLSERTGVPLTLQSLDRETAKRRLEDERRETELCRNWRDDLEDALGIEVATELQAEDPDWDLLQALCNLRCRLRDAPAPELLAMFHRVTTPKSRQAMISKRREESRFMSILKHEFCQQLATVQG